MMKFLEMLIHRPVVAIVLNLLLVLGGVIGFKKLGINQYPNITLPLVSVTTTYIGADPELIERCITTPIEDKLSGIEGLKYFTSVSAMNSSTISATFELGTNMDAAVSEVRNRVQQAQDQFPSEARPPIVNRASAGEPIMYMMLSSNEWDTLRLTELYQTELKTRLQSVPGVQEVSCFGINYAMRIWLDPEKLASRNLTPLDVVNAVNSQNIDLPGGQVDSKDRQYNVMTISQLNTPKDFNNMILAYRNNYPIRIRDIGRADYGGEYEPPTFGFILDGRSTCGMAVKIYETANALEVANAIKQLVPKLNASMPADVKLGICYDTTLFINDSINEVVTTIIEAVILVMIVVSLFLWSPRAISIPIITIPLSLLGAMAFMFVAGFTINIMTLLAMVLAIGLVVDDSIVEVENVFRHLELGVDPINAAIISNREIRFAVTTTTLILAIVYAPVGMQSGQTGQLFKEFAFTLAGTVLISGYVAMTLSPMMSARLLKPPKKKPGKEGHGRLANFYEKLLRVILGKHRLAVVIGTVVIAVAAYLIFSIMPGELVPTEDQNVIMVFYQAPEGSNWNHMAKCAESIDKILKDIPEKETVLDVIGYPQSNQGLAIMVLKPKDQRKKSQQQIVGELMGPMWNIPGAMAIPLNPPPPGLSGSSNQEVNFVMTTIGEYTVLEKAVDQLMDQARTYQYVNNIQKDLNLRVLNFDVTPNRDLSATVGITANNIAGTLASSLAPNRATHITKKGRNYDVYIQIPAMDRNDPWVLDRLYLRNNTNNSLVQMSTLIDFTPRICPIMLNHYQGQRSVTLNADVAPGSSLDKTLEYLENAARHELQNVTPQFTGYSQTFKESAGQFVIVFGMALIVVYLLLSAVFNSFIDPFIILLTVPLSLLGGLSLLALTGGTINLYSQIGLITLIGLITKQGILIVDFANVLRREGKSVFEAIIEASKLRLRPILMTTGAMVLGAVPLAFASGAGSESRHPLGWVIIGGLTFGTLLTLIVIPTFYSFVAWLEKRPAEEQPPAAGQTDASGPVQS